MDKEQIEKPDENLNAVSEDKKLEQSENEIKAKQQKEQVIQAQEEKTTNKPEDEQLKHSDKQQREVDFNQIFAVFYAKQEISEEGLAEIQKKIQEDCSKQLLKQFKQTLSKSMDTNQKQFSLQKYKEWVTHKRQKIPVPIQSHEKQEGEGKKQMKEQPIPEVKDKSNQKPKVKVNSMGNVEDKLFNLLTRYFKPPVKQLEKKVLLSNNFNIEINFSTTSPLQNALGFDIKILIGEKEITQIHTEYESKKIITPKEGRQYLIIQVETKKGEVIQQLIEQSLKQKKINIEGCEFKTNTDEKNLYVGLCYDSGDASSRLKKINSIFLGGDAQNNCKIRMHGKFGLGNEGKTKPEDRKLIKCLSKGFEFNLNVSANPAINHRLRKNIQLEHPESVLYSLLALTKNSDLKLKLKKMQDVNIVFSKLGILQAVKTTPTIKQVLNDYLHQLFGLETLQSFDLPSFLTLILKDAESSKITITKLDEKDTLISASVSQQKNVGTIINK